MPEQEKMDHLLREMLAATPPPALSAAFDQRLKRRLRPRRMSAAGRLILAGYALFALMFSIWAMRSQSIDWSVIAIAILAPLMVAAVVSRQVHGNHQGRVWREVK
jgi:type VI protein secretion system component VasF